MGTVYVDSVFALNALTDYLLLLATARLAGIPLRRRRYLLAAAAGGVYAAAVFLPAMAFLERGSVKIAAGVLLALAAFGGEARLLRLTLLFFLLSFVYGGCVMALGLLCGSAIPGLRGVFYTDVDGKILLIAATALYPILSLTFRGAAAHGIRAELLDARLCLNGRCVSLRLLLDTGNSLRDPATGMRVLVAEGACLRGCFPQEVQRLLTEEALRAPAELPQILGQKLPALRWRLLPYHAVGVADGLLLTARADWAQIGGERREGIPVALAPGSIGGDYQALWGGRAGKRGRNEAE